MRKQHAADVAIAGVLAVLGLAMAIHSVSYRILGEGGRIGPGFLPFVAGLALTAFAAWAATETALRARRAQASQPPLPREASQASGSSPSQTTVLERKVALVFLLVVGACLLTTLTGFLIAFGLLTLVLLAAVEREPTWLATVIAVVAIAVAWLVFVRLLGVPLPGGALGLLGVPA